MKHLRQHYLEQLQILLKTATVFKGVWIQRTRRKQNSMYPQITIYPSSETVEHPAANNSYRETDRSQTRTVNIIVRIWTQQNDDAEKLERDFNNHSLAVESVLKNSFGAIDLMLQNTEFDAHEEDEEPTIHTVTLTYTLTYYSQESNPTIA